MKSGKDSIYIHLKDAYAKITAWYIANRKGAPEESLRLIDAFPLPEKATELEMRCIMCEVIGGYLEYAGYENGDGEFYWSDYAKASFGTGGFRHLNDIEITEIKKSKLLPYLSYGFTIPKTREDIDKGVEELLNARKKSKNDNGSR